MKHLFRAVLPCLLVLAMYAPSLIAKAALSKRTIYAAPRGGSVRFDGRKIAVEEVGTAFKKARPGDEIILLPGNYRKNLQIQKQGDIDAPIVISGADSMTTFACNDLPTGEGKPAISISVSEGLILRGLNFENCWPYAIEIVDSSHIEIANNTFKGGNHVAVLRERSTHHITIANNHWQQNLTDKAPATAVAVPTATSIADEATNVNKNDSMGDAFVRASAVSGDIVIEGNQIAKASSILLLEGLIAPFSPTKNIQLTGNKAETSVDPAITVVGGVDYLWISDNEWGLNNGLIAAKGASLQNAFVVNNRFNRAPDATQQVPLFTFDTKVGLNVFHNSFKCSGTLFDDLAAGSTVAFAQNDVEVCDDLPLVNSNRNKGFKSFNNQLYRGINVIAAQRKLGLDSNSTFTTAAKPSDVRKLHPDFSRVSFGSERRAPGVFTASVRDIGPWPLLLETDYDATPSSITALQLGKTLTVLFDRPIPKSIRGIMIDNDPSEKGPPRPTFCKIKRPATLSCGLSGTLDPQRKLGFDIYGPDNSIEINVSTFTTEFIKFLKPQQMPGETIKRYHFKL